MYKYNIRQYLGITYIQLADDYTRLAKFNLCYHYLLICTCIYRTI